MRRTSLACALSGALLASSACHERGGKMISPDQGPEAPRSVATSTAFEGTVRVDDHAGPGKKFLGAFIERDGGERWVIDYAETSPYRVLRDRRVRVEGEVFVPDGQALLATHFRVNVLTSVGKGDDAPLVRIGPQRKLEGRFSEKTWEPGTKLAGEKMGVFIDAAGKSYFLAHAPTPAPALGVSVKVEGHDVSPSPFVTRPSGAWLWVRRIVPDGE